MHDNSTMKVDGMALLGREPAKRASEVNETMHSDPQRLAQAQTNYEENQHSNNATKDVPSMHGLPLMGEWIVCASGKASECCQQLAGVDGDAGRKAKPVDTMNVPEALVTMSIDLENSDSGDILHMHLGSTSWQAGDVNRLGDRVDGANSWTDGSTCQVDASKGLTDGPSRSNDSETDVIGHAEGARMYLGIGDMKHAVFEMDGIRSHADMSTGHGEALSVESNTIKPISAPKRLPDESDGLRNQMDASSIRMDAYTIGNKIETTKAQMAA